MTDTQNINNTKVHGCLETSITSGPSNASSTDRAMWLAEQLIKKWNRYSCEYTQYTRSSLANELAELNEPNSMNFLMNNLKNPDADVRENAAWALGYIGSNSSIGALTEALNDEHNHVRYFAAQALKNICGSYSCPRTAPAIFEMEKKYAYISPYSVLEHPDYAVRWRAAEQMVKYLDPMWTNAFEKALNDECPAVRFWSLIGLAKLLGPEALPAIEFALNNDEHCDVRDKAKIALAHISKSFNYGYHAADQCMRCER